MTRRTAKRSAGVAIAGSGISIPSQVLTNDDLAQRVDTSDEWITKRTGIRERRVIENSQMLEDLAADAAASAIAKAGILPDVVDMLIVATMTPEMNCPSTAARVVDRIGATPAGAVDVAAACSGFVYGLNMGAALIESGFYRHVVVVGAEVLSKAINWDDRRTCILFADGAAAVVLSACDDPERGCLHQTMSSDGSLWHELYVPRSDEHVPPQSDVYNGRLNTLQMNGREVYKFAVKKVEQTIEEAMQATGLKPDDLAMIIAHQSNRRILESARERLGLPPEKLYINIDRYGNTSAASVPICFYELVEAGRLKQGDLVLFSAMGGGMTWTSSLWRL